MVNKVLVIGDSLVYGKGISTGGWVTELRKYVDRKYGLSIIPVLNLGIPGEMVGETEKRLPAELDCRIKTKENNLVLILVGAGDCFPGNKKQKRTSKEEFKKSFRKMFRYAMKKNCTVVSLGLTPKAAEELEDAIIYDSYIAEVCEEVGVLRIKLLDYLLSRGYKNLLIDSVHPNFLGYTLIAKRVKETLEKAGFL